MSSPNSTKDMARSCRILTKPSNREMGLLKGPAGKIVNTPKKTVNHLMDTLFPGSQETKEVSSPIHAQLSNHKIDQDIFTKQKVAAAF